MGFLSDFLFGKKDGPFESYYKNGQLEEKGTYKDGEWDGLWEEYYKNGQLKGKGHLQGWGVGRTVEGVLQERSVE
jgi:antitoxin component YwqK of YwqJK toxin-antitoxin module